MNPIHDEPSPSSAPSQYEERAGYPAEQAFAPGDGRAWSRVSRRHTWSRGLSATLWCLLAGAGGALAGWKNGGATGAVIIVALAVVVLAFAWIVAELTHRSYGYAERDDDLVLTYGVFVKRLIVVPYGRMQFVDVTAGPLDRVFGIATVRLHTAAAATDASIPALPVAEATALRDRLARKGEERSMGL
ncbi:PH domain-containing protein [Actinomadura flavalba]|uniref:PH domain-containing protein n=1 Tax=Actinomadura flavalba TaxID=1120938 RepID=UPI000365D263|nr:PH domain-containing protein [Actinomadura flavalba]